MKNVSYFLIMFLCISCQESIPKKQSDFFFQIPGIELGITCSKRIGAEFYVMFSKDSTQLSENVDYLKYKTGDMSEVNLIFDPQNKNNIYINETEYLKEIHPVNYNLQVLSNSEFDSMFFEPRIKTDPLVLKYPFIQVGISTSGYAIYLKKYEILYNNIKEGDIYGGW